ncbi:MAG: patatin-like phospholipase family protein [Nitriliruptorales bacterium]|nr:patatin-like phospholipase family protein [Nitriliruptorales bacterium]
MPDEPDEPDQKVGLVLSGGGAKGAFGAGVIAAFEDASIDVDLVSGASAGALNAAAVATGIGADELIGLWSELESRDVYRVRKDVHRLVRPWHLISRPDRLLGLGHHTTTEHLAESIGWTWLLETGPLRELLVDLLGGEEVAVRDGCAMVVSCVDVGTGDPVRFANTAPPDHRPGHRYRAGTMTVDHLVASAAIPGLFEPIRIDGDLYWDGGLVANTPLKALMPYEPDIVYVVASGAIDRDAGDPASLGEVVALVVDHVMRYSLIQDVDHARTVNELVRADPNASYHRDVEIVVISPDHARSGLGQLLDFEPSVARELIDAGYDIARDAIRSGADR